MAISVACAAIIAAVVTPPIRIAIVGIVGTIVGISVPVPWIDPTETEEPRIPVRAVVPTVIVPVPTIVPVMPSVISIVSTIVPMASTAMKRVSPTSITTTVVAPCQG
jgi:hypothetical protein